jgi:TonB family protein
MSSLTTTSAASSTAQDRRSQTRRRLEELVYADFGPSNGGIILDMSEGGFAFQSVEPLEQCTTFAVKFKLPGVATPMEAIAEPAWLIDSEKRGGLKFRELAESARSEIKTWATPEIRVSADIERELTRADAPVSGLGREAGHSRQQAAQPAEPGATAVEGETPVLSPPVSSQAQSPIPRDTPVAAAPTRDLGTYRAATNPMILVKPQNLQAAPTPGPVKPGQEPGNDSTPWVLKLATAAAIAASALALAAALPTLRTKFPAAQDNGAQIIDNPSIGTSDFHVEAVDRDGRRWILKDGETAAVSSINVSSRRGAQAAESLRNEARKQPAASAEGNAETRLNEVPELALKQPRRETTRDAAADPGLPSIFDGITPPIPAFDAGGPPLAPGPVQPLPTASARAANLQAATLIYRVAPLYPDLARQRRLQGEVRVSATVGKDGALWNLKPLSGDPRLIPAALSAIGHWRYKPTTLNGEAIESEVIVTTAFELK